MNRAAYPGGGATRDLPANGQNRFAVELVAKEYPVPRYLAEPNRVEINGTHRGLMGPVDRGPFRSR